MENPFLDLIDQEEISDSPESQEDSYDLDEEEIERKRIPEV